MSTVPTPQRYVVRTRYPRLALRLDRRALIVTAGCIALCTVAVAITLAGGRDLHVAAGDLLPTLLGHGDPSARLIVVEFRLPRALTALLVGASLAVAGAIFQRIAGNPLVSPDVIGVNGGAELAVIAAVVVWHSTAQPTLFAVYGGLATALAVFVLSIRSGLAATRIVLIGIAFNGCIGSIATFLLSHAREDQLARLNAFLLGDLSGATWSTFYYLTATVITLSAAALALARHLEMLRLGDQVAAGIGVPVIRVRIALLVIGVALAAAAVAAAGPVGFVAFICPHIATKLAPTASTAILVVAAGVGASVVIIADYLAEHLIAHAQLPVGLVTVLLGAPYFLYRLVRATRSHTV